MHNYLNQNSQAVKKECGPQKGQGEKRCEIQGGSQEMAVMDKNFNYDNSGEFALPPPLGFGTKFTRIVVIKIFLLIYHHSHFLAATLDFTSFFTLAFLGAAFFFYSLAVLV